MLKKLKTEIILGILFISIFYLEIKSYFSIGFFINKIFPCKELVENSFPCFAIYDIYFMLILVLSFLVLLAISIIKLLKTRNIRTKSH